MRLRWWELLGLVAPMLAGALLYVSGHWVGGTVVVCATVFVAASRARIVERNIAGFYARTRGTLLLLRATALFGVYAMLVYGWFVMHREHWTRDRHGLVAFYATAGLAIFLLRDIRKLGDESDRWLMGGEMEEAVAGELDSLRLSGWIVVHNVVRDDGWGNVDHFVSSPRGAAFAVETKSGRLRAAHRGQAISNAIWVKDKFGARYVTAVVCVGEEAPTEPMLLRHGSATVWVVGRPGLAKWLLSRVGG